MGSSRKPKRKRKHKEHPLVTALKEVYEGQIGIREIVIDQMYDECLDIAEKNVKALRDYIQ